MGDGAICTCGVTQANVSQPPCTLHGVDRLTGTITLIAQPMTLAGNAAPMPIGQVWPEQRDCPTCGHKMAVGFRYTGNIMSGGEPYHSCSWCDDERTKKLEREKENGWEGWADALRRWTGQVSSRDAEIARLRGRLERIEKAAMELFGALSSHPKIGYYGIDFACVKALRSALDDHGGE